MNVCNSLDVVWLVKYLNFINFFVKYCRKSINSLTDRAKMRWCVFWPSRIVTAPKEMGKPPKGKICVFFFGTKNL